MDGEPSGPTHEVLRRAFAIAGATGQACRPVHLLEALSDAGGPVGAALRTPGGAPLWRREPLHEPQERGGIAGYLVMVTEEAARALAAGRDEPMGPAHLLLAVVDQAEPEAMALLAGAGIDVAALRARALRVLGAPADLPRIRVPDPVPAGTMDRPPLPVDALDPRAWASAERRQRQLPLRRLRRRSHYHALCHLERRAAWRIASRLGLDDDQRYSLTRHHLERVEELAAQARPELTEAGQRRRSGPGGPAVTAGWGASGPVGRRRRRVRLGLPTGWVTWLSNRRVGLRNGWFRVRTAGSYRGAPPP